MVKKSHTKRKRDIKTKLMAAICMLLVSSIMMVSTTYAWFTLSTAPEVTGINTAVGANGNLEMALVPVEGLTAIGSNVGDSIAALNVRNTTWGNLVDLSYAVDNANYYGLDKISLYPSALNLAQDGTLADAILKTPAYGADGRVSNLLANTVTSIFNTTSKTFAQDTGFGVRAVGTASGMTDRQLAYRNARSAANTAMSMAKTLSSQSLNTNGASLANIAVSHAANQGSETYEKADINNLLAIVNDLLGVEGGKTGVLEYIEDAYLNYIVALGASAASNITDEQFKAFESAVTGAADLYAAIDLLADHGVSVEATVLGYIEDLQETRATVQDAKDGLESITAETGIKWGDFDDYLTLLADMDKMEINGYAASTFRDNMSNIINKVTTEGLTVSIATGGGVYADVADHCGNFNASITIERVEYNGLTLNNMTARMTTKTTVSPVYLTRVSTAVEEAGAPTGAGGQTMPISDFYGYIVDLAFRTNAAESNLLLQTEATDRIYGENGTEETMGHGSTMTFTSTTTDFTVDQLKNLMSAIRVVFFDPANRNMVLGTAKLDLGENAYTVTGGNTITANLYLYKQTAGGTTYVAATADQKTDGTKLYTKDADADTYTEFTGTPDDSTAYFVQVVTAAGEQKLTGNDAVIKALTQNTPTSISALVYLDGAHITNADVAATASTSMTGTLNLQFASSANLVPMEYTQLMNQGTGTPEEG